MNTETDLSKIKTLKNQEYLNGRWELTYKLVNSEGERGFSGKTISVYTDAITGKARFLYDLDGNILNGFLIDRVKKIYKPSEDPLHRNIIDWLIGHPEVGIEEGHVKIDSRYQKRKDGNPRIKLVNLDHIETVDLEEEDYIDKLIGRVSLDSGTLSIGLDKLRFILSAIDRPYFEAKHMNNPSKEKQFLRKSLKDFIRSSFKNAELVNQVLDDLSAAKLRYEIKELKRLEILDFVNGMYKYHGQPIGSSVESVIKYFGMNIELHEEIMTILYDALKSEIASIK